MLTVASVNVNGIRAAFRRGMDAWLADRWVEANLDTPSGPLTVVSVYVHKGEAGTAGWRPSTRSSTS